MEQIPFWEDNQFSASQEIPRSFWNPKVHYLIYKSHPPVSIQSQVNPVHASIRLLKSHLKLSFHLRLGLPSGLFPRFTHTTWGEGTNWRPRHVVIMIVQLLYFLW